jgi:hypothetical protein
MTEEAQKFFRRGLWGIVLLLSGCLTSTTNQSGYLGSSFTTITIQHVYNHTRRGNLDQIFHREAKRYILKDGRLRLVDTGADVLMTVVLKSLSEQKQAFDENGDVVKKRLRLICSVDCLTAKGEPVWRSRAVETAVSFAVTPGSFTETRPHIEDVCRLFSRKMVNKITSGFIDE